MGPGLRIRIYMTLGLFLAFFAAASLQRHIVLLDGLTIVPGLTLAVAVIRALNRQERAQAGLAASSSLLRDAHDELRDLYENAPTGYHSIDADGLVVRMNDTELRWLGYTRDEVVGRMRVSELVMPSGRAETARRLAAFLQTDRIHDVFVEYRRKDGTVLPALMSATAVRDTQGRFVMTRTVVTDITEHWRTQRELEAVVAELELAMASIRTLTGLLPMCSVCHKIRNDSGYWDRIEHYVTTHTEAQVSHGVCPECFPKLYPGIEMEEDEVVAARW